MYETEKKFLIKKLLFQDNLKFALFVIITLQIQL